MLHQPTPILKTKDLLLRPFQEGDAFAIFTNWANDARVTKYLNWFAHPSEKTSAMVLSLWLEDEKEERCNRWAIIPRGETTPCGSIDIVKEEGACAEIGYCLGYKWWNHGYMTQALCAVRDYLFSETGLEKLYLCHHIDNPASGKVMEKAGLHFIGLSDYPPVEKHPKGYRVKGYELTKEEWIKLKNHP